MEVTGTVVGTRREQDTASSHPVYILDGSREVHAYASAIYVGHQLPKIGDKVTIDGSATPSGQFSAKRVEVLTPTE